MSQHSLEDVVILVADVTASVELYERVGDACAFAIIAGMLDKLRSAAESGGGAFIQSRGDDVLCIFEDVAGAADAAASMLGEAALGEVKLHVAIHRGEAIVARDSIFGDAVNVAYRLASIANTNEALASDSVVERLEAGRRKTFRPLRSFRFKGKALPIEVFALDEHGTQLMTQLPAHLLDQGGGEDVVLRLSYSGERWEVGEAESLSIGRSEGVDVLIDRQWVSRRHAVLHVRDGVAMLTDRSSYGSFVSPGGTMEVMVRRQSVPLAGSGLIGLGTSITQPEAERLEYAVVRADIATPA